ncbi:MAG TPA: hypothetical protein VJQ43_00165 [Thermoplasmata archaeon]|nr:hypothetical protein [Thermoplasmata archaeon]
MADPQPRRLTLVLAHWCPHCYPLSTERAPKLAQELGVPLRLLDIDVRKQELEADALVRDHGDWDPDYLIPQLFLEWNDGSVDHLLTGVPGSTEGTRRRWETLLSDRAPILARATGST